MMIVNVIAVIVIVKVKLFPCRACKGTGGTAPLILNFYAIWFGLVYLFIHSVTYVTLDTPITDYNVQHIL
jgi:hypothetical protein